MAYECIDVMLIMVKAIKLHLIIEMKNVKNNIVLMS